MLLTAASWLLTVALLGAQENPAPPDPVPPRWSPHAVFGTRIGDDQAEGRIDLLGPIWSDPDSMLFLYPGLGLSSDVDPGFSFGLGGRHYFERFHAILGAGVFFDRYDSPYGNFYNQLGLGAELLTDWFDFRINGYLPESERHLIDSRTVSNHWRTVSCAEPYATGHSILQEITTTDTTLNRLFERFEDSMQGYDAEFGALVPGIDRFADLRLFLGYYDFENAFGDDLNGLKARAELRLSDKLAFDATWYEDEEVAGDDWVFGIRLNVPIFPENLKSGRSPFKGSFDGLFGGHRDRAGRTRRRMTEEILRYPQVRTSSSEFTENVAEREIKKKVETDTKVIADRLIFVNNGGPVGNGILAGSSTGNGTAEHPVNQIGLGVERVVTLLGGSGTVYVQGGRAPYAEDVSVGFDGTSFGSNNGAGVHAIKIVSSFKGIPACGGHVFGGDTPRPVTQGFDIRGGASGTVRSATITGFEMTGLSAGPNTGHGLYAENVPDLLVNCNVIRSTIDGADSLRLYYDGNNVGRVRIIENHIVSDADAADGVDLDADDLSVVDVVLRNNDIRTLGPNSDGVDVETGGLADVIFDLYGNRIVTLSDDSSGLDFESYDDSILNTIVAGNSILTHGSFSSPIDFISDDDSLLVGTLFQNRFTSTADFSDGVSYESYADSVSDILQWNNTIVTGGESTDGIYAAADDGSLMLFSSLGDQITTTAEGAWGIDLYAKDFAELDARVYGATVRTSLDDSFGIWTEVVDNAYAEIFLENNRITTLGDNAPGIVVVSDTTASPIMVTLGDNRISTVGVDSDGIGIIADTDIIFLPNGPPAGTNVISTLGASDIFVVPATGSALGTIIVNGNIVAPPVTGDFP